jgi:aromatic-L-amino-acid/L-tryptophan decarboxylase
MPGLTHWQSPNFMAWFPANATYPSMLGELYSAAFTAPAFNWLCSPAVTELETIVLDWMCKALALPASFLSTGEGGGVIQGSASEAGVTVAVAARERYVKRQTEGMEEGEAKAEQVGRLRAKMVGLASDQAHSLTQKAMGICATKFRTIRTDAANDFALTGKDVRDALEQAQRDGLEPYFLTVSLGATPTCAVDRFEEIAAVAKDYPEVWIHVDAAYAGAALVCEEYQHLSKQLGTFDSFDMNMHKWLLTNFDARYAGARQILPHHFALADDYTAAYSCANDPT